MPKPIAFNTGTKKAGSLKQGNVELGNLTSVDYGANYGGLTWYNSLDADTGYVIMTDTYTMGLSTFSNSKPVIWKTPDFTDESILTTINGLPNRVGQTKFTGVTEAFTWSSSSGAFFNLSSNQLDIISNGLSVFLDGNNVTSYPEGGATWYDLSGNGNHGTLVNQPTFDPTNGGSIYFDGTNDYVLVSNSSSLDISSGDFAVESFFYFPSGVTVDNKYRPIMVLTPSNSQNSNIYLGLVRSGLIGGTPLYAFFNNSANKSGFITKIFANYVYGGTDYNAGGKWNHVVLTQISNTLYFYINGLLSASLSGTYTANSGNQNLYIGGDLQGEGYNIGNVSYVRFYKGKGLTSSEVLQNYSESLPILKENLVLNLDVTNPLSNVGIQPVNFPTYLGPTLPITNGLKLWLDSSDKSSFTFVGTTAVSKWNDKSGNNNHATSLGSAYPNLNLTKNTYPTLYFNGSAYMTTPNLISGTYTKIVVHKMTGGANLVSSSNGQHAFWYGGGPQLQIYHSGTFVTQTASTVNTWCIGTAEFNFDVSPYVGSISVNNGGTVSGTTNNGPGNSDIELMGFGGAANFGSGHIAEVLVYNKILSVSEKSQIQTYLNNKWGITTNGPEIGIGSNGDWFDRSFYRNNVVTTNGVSFNDANFPNYLSFDGIDDYINFYAPKLTNVATIEMWCKIPSNYSNTMFMGWQSYDIWCYNGTIGFNTFNSDVYGISQSTVTSLNIVNNWAHYIFEFRGDVSYVNNKIYINGVRQTLSQQFSNESTGSISLNGGYGRISSSLNGGYNMGFALNIFRVYNRVLTQSEITQNYNVLKGRFGL
jgi:hypothetical protein